MVPIIEMLTKDEVDKTIARGVLAQKGLSPKEAETLLKNSVVRVEFKNVKIDGKTYLFTTVGIVRAEPDDVKSTSTPIPEAKNG